MLGHRPGIFHVRRRLSAAEQAAFVPKGVRDIRGTAEAQEVLYRWLGRIGPEQKGFARAEAALS